MDSRAWVALGVFVSIGLILAALKWSGLWLIYFAVLVTIGTIMAAALWIFSWWEKEWESFAVFTVVVGLLVCLCMWLWRATSVWYWLFGGG